MYHNLFAHSPAEGSVGSFQILAIMNRASINLPACVCVDVFLIFNVIILCNISNIENRE